MRIAVLLVLTFAAVARAQEFSAPPLVQADVVDPSQGRTIAPPVITNAPLDPNTQTPAPQPLPSRPSGTLQPQAPAPIQPDFSAYPQPGQPGQPTQPGTVQRSEPEVNPRLVRVGMASVLGAAIGTVAAVAGGFIGGEYLRPGLTPIGNIWTGGAIGFAIGAPVGVLIAGALFHGNAPWYAPILGDLLGAAVGAAAVAFGGPDALSATFVLPLLGSVIGYEVGSAEDARVAPVLSVLPGGRGGVVGVQGRW